VLNIKTIEQLAQILEVNLSTLLRVLARVDLLTQKLTISDRERPNKKPRVVYNPRKSLRHIQKAIYKKLLLPNFSRSPHSYGGVKGKNAVDCVQQHAKQRFFYSCDIKSFFPSIHFSRVKRLFLRHGCSDDVARALTRLTTHNHRLEQGFLTSPIIADRIFRQADRRIASLAKKHGLVYTRFVDDITISAPFNLKKSKFPRMIGRIIADTAFRIKKNKSSDGSINGKRIVLGLRLKKGQVDVQKVYFEETNRRLEDLRELSNNRSFNGPYFTRPEILGRIRYICWVNPNRRRMFINLWKQLDWKAIHQYAKERGIAIREGRFTVTREAMP
jgi:RNA-directed DNA polymerase